MFMNVWYLFMVGLLPAYMYHNKWSWWLTVNMKQDKTFSTIIRFSLYDQMIEKWNESGFRPPLCTYRLNWARRTSWGWWDDWDDTVLQTRDSKFEPWRSEAEHAISRSRKLPTILTFTRGWRRNIFCFFSSVIIIIVLARFLYSRICPPREIGET